MVRPNTILQSINLDAYTNQKSILNQAIEAIETLTLLAGIHEKQDIITRTYFEDICDKLRSLL